MAFKMKTSNLYAAIILLIIGALIMNFYGYKIFGIPDNSLPKEYAKVEKVNGLLVFIQSEPVQEYEIIDEFEGNSFVSVIDSLGIGKEDFSQVMHNILSAGNDNLIFYKKLTGITKKVKEKYKNADAVIFKNKLNTCEVIEFR